MNAENTPPPSKPNEAAPAVAETVETTPPLPFGYYGERLASASLMATALPADATGREQVRLEPCCLLKAAALLQADAEHPLDLLLSLTAVDLKTHREVVYHFHSTASGKQLALKVAAPESETLPSLMSIYHAADWHEREAYDLMGLVFEGHSDLRRILMPDYWVGHPLRKDYVQEDPRLLWNQR